MVKIDSVEKAGLLAVSEIATLLRDAKTDSLIEYTKALRVEPIVLMDQRVMHQPYTSDIMQSLCSIFSGYYLQAVSLMFNEGIAGVNAMRNLDRANPNRDPVGNFYGTAATLSTESYQYALPRPGEATGLAVYGLENRRGRGDGEDTRAGMSLGRDTVKLSQDAADLSVGKLLEVTVEDGARKAVFPVSVRLIVSGIDPSLMVHTLALDVKDMSAKERFHEWRSGQIRFMRDLVLCQDLIDQHKKNLLNDPADFYSTTMKRRQKNRLSAIFSGTPSVATASNIYVISQTTAKELEAKLSGRLSNFRTREKLFKDTYGMIMVVVDTEWEQATFYHRSIETPTELSVKEMKRANRGNGPDVFEILRAYQLGTNPSI